MRSFFRTLTLAPICTFVPSFVGLCREIIFQSSNFTEEADIHSGASTPPSPDLIFLNFMGFLEKLEKFRIVLGEHFDLFV